MKKKLTILFALAFAAAVFMTGCAGAAEIKKPTPDGTVFDVTGSCAAELNDGVLKVTGQTNLMDGTNGIIGVMNSDGTRVDQIKVTKQGDNLQAQFTVNSSWPKTVYAYIMFDTSKSDGQPDAVKAAYGKSFQNLEGDNVIWDQKGNIAIFQSEAITIS